MSFKRILLAGAALALLTGSGCGLLGKKDDLSLLLKMGSGNIGCLNDMGPKFQKYAQGEISEQEWGATWDCAINSLTMFRNFVSTGDAGGYSQSTILSFVSKFMVTSNPISNDLIGAVFDLKASIFGGSSAQVTPDELGKFISMLQIGKEESLKLLPHVRNRAKSPTPDHLTAFADALASAGKDIAAALASEGNPDFKLSSMNTLIRELGKMLGMNPPDGSAELVIALKEFLAGGSRIAIEGKSWSPFFASVSEAGAAAVAMASFDSSLATGPNATGNFQFALAGEIKDILLRSARIHGGAIPNGSVANLIQSLPASVLIAKRKDAIISFLGPLANKILGSQYPDGIDSNAVNFLFSQLSFENSVQTQLETIFTKYALDPSGASAAEIVNAATDYVQGEGSRARKEIDRLVYLVMKFKPLYQGSDSEITFLPFDTYSMSDLGRMHWIRLLVEVLFLGYSSDRTHSRGTLADLTSLITDITPIATGFAMMDPTVPNMAARRFREANLFLPDSNGDEYFDLDEATYYVSFYMSIAHLSLRVVDKALNDYHCGLGQGEDVYETEWMDQNCFRKMFFANYRTFWDHAPELIRFYESLNPVARKQFELSFEGGARRYGVSSAPVGRYDIDGFTGTMHFIESVFQRFDADGNGILNTSETLTAYPVFKQAIVDMAKATTGQNLTSDFLVKSIFTYIVQHQKQPDMHFPQVLDFVAWVATEPFWNIQASRANVYTILSMFSVPEPLPPGVVPVYP